MAKKKKKTKSGERDGNQEVDDVIRFRLIKPHDILPKD